MSTFVDWSRNELGLYLPPKPAKPKRIRPIGIDLFCGAGGFGLGMHQAGFDIVAASDFDVSCMQTYLYNLGAYPVNLQFIEPSDEKRAESALKRMYREQGFLDKKGNWTGDLTNSRGDLPWVSGGNRQALLGDRPGCGVFFLGDIRKLTGERILKECGLERGDVDVVFGGPPCQGYSVSGKRDVMDPRNSLLFEFARLVLEINPKTFIMENVPGLVSMMTPEGLPVIDAFCRVVSDGGFGPIDAIKKSLLESSGAGAALRSKGRPANEADANEPDEDTGSEAIQMEMFA